MLFSDMEGSTLLLSRLGAAYAEVLDAQRDLLRGAWSVFDGTEMGTEGDSFFVVFGTAEAAVAAAVEGQRQLAGHVWPDGVAVRVRMGIHTGTPTRHGDGYVGLDVHRGSRIAASAHGGQVVVSASTAELVRDALPVGVTIRDLGVQRLKDFPRPERLFQLMIEGTQTHFPPLKALGATSILPRPATSLVGRSTELGDLAALLAGSDVRLVTLTGPGGTGKTRLAVEIATQLAEHHADGAYFVALAEATAPEQIWTTLAEALDVPPEARTTESILEQVGLRDALLVLDNLEQIPSADAPVARLLDAAPRITVIATTRHPLHVPGERQYPVPPLRLPNSDTWAQPGQAGAVELFVQNARTFKPDFKLTADNRADILTICRRLDGLPLAIELAAARIKLLSPRALLARLDQALDLNAVSKQAATRHRTLRDTIAWSYKLLDPDEQSLFRRMAVFAGGTSLDGITSVALGVDGTDPDASTTEAIDLISKLVDASVVVVHEDLAGEPRIAMLQTIRAYARDELAWANELDLLRHRHFDYHLATARRWQSLLRDDLNRSTLGRFETELDNFRAALSWALTLPESDADRPLPPSQVSRTTLALRLCSALHTFWYTSGYLIEERHWLELAVARSGTHPSADLAHCLALLAEIAHDTCAFDRAQAYATASVNMCRELDDVENLPKALVAKAFAEADSGSPADYRATFREAIVAAKKVDDRSQAAWAYVGLAYYETSHERRLELLRQARDLFENHGDVRGVLTTTQNMACTLRMLSRPEEAQQLMRSIIPQYVAGNGPADMVTLAEDYAAILAALEVHVIAVRLLGAADATRQQIGLPRSSRQSTEIAEPLRVTRTTLSEAGWDANYKAGRNLLIDQALTEAAR